MSESLADLKLTWFREATELTSGSLADAEFAYWSELSGLTPVAKFSVADHKYAALSEAWDGSDGPNLSDLYRNWLEATPDEAIADAEYRKFSEPFEEEEV